MLFLGWLDVGWSHALWQLAVKTGQSRHQLPVTPIMIIVAGCWLHSDDRIGQRVCLKYEWGPPANLRAVEHPGTADSVWKGGQFSDEMVKRLIDWLIVGSETVHFSNGCKGWWWWMMIGWRSVGWGPNWIVIRSRSQVRGPTASSNSFLGCCESFPARPHSWGFRAFNKIAYKNKSFYLEKERKLDADLKVIEGCTWTL